MKKMRFENNNNNLKRKKNDNNNHFWNDKIFAMFPIYPLFTVKDGVQDPLHVLTRAYMETS